MGRGEAETLALERDAVSARARGARGSSEPETLYHVSPKRNSASIAREGLTAQNPSDESEPAVYLFGSLEEAQQTADSSSEIYSVRRDDLGELQRVGDLGSPWWKSPAGISSERLRIVGDGDEAELSAFDRHRFTQGDCWIFALALQEASPELKLAKSELTDHAFCVAARESGGGPESSSGSLVSGEPPQAHLWDAIDVHGRERLDKFLLRGVINRELWLCDNDVTHPTRRERVRSAAARALERLEGLSDETDQTATEEILFQFSNESEDLHLWDCDLTDGEYLREWGPEEDFEGSWARARELARQLV